MIPLNENLSRMRRSGIRAYTELARAVPDCVMLTIGEPEFATPQPIRQAAWAALEAGQTHYAPNAGLLELRQAIARQEGRKTSEILVTVGASGALFTALLGVLNPGDQVIVPIPAFPLYESIITMAGAELVPLDTSGDGFQIREAALLPLVTEKTKAMVLNSPHNPTGVVYDRESLAAVKKALLGKPIFLVSDQVYQGLCLGEIPSLAKDPDLQEQLLLCQSFSKPYAMTGWRVGYLAGPEEVMGRLLLLSAAEIASVPTFLQAACVTALETDNALMAETYAQRREYVCRRLRAMGLDFPRPEGAFYVFVNIARFGLSSDEFCRRMIREAGVAAVPGSCFGTEGYLRLSYCCAQEALEKGLDRMEAFLKRL
ncbi:MAG TPA: pyridoxal phosphate-dependent aminotransferase [Candidatus Faecousia intestinigallinarum]|nr:pyridoxal phosphate-dependent aminotransferase [Candidatus Faecousia intestinigallinarum]